VCLKKASVKVHRNVVLLAMKLDIIRWENTYSVFAKHEM